MVFTDIHTFHWHVGHCCCGPWSWKEKVWISILEKSSTEVLMSGQHSFLFIFCTTSYNLGSVTPVDLPNLGEGPSGTSRGVRKYPQEPSCCYFQSTVIYWKNVFETYLVTSFQTNVTKIKWCSSSHLLEDLEGPRAPLSTVSGGLDLKPGRTTDSQLILGKLVKSIVASEPSSEKQDGWSPRFNQDRWFLRFFWTLKFCNSDFDLLTSDPNLEYYLFKGRSSNIDVLKYLFCHYKIVIWLKQNL